MGWEVGVENRKGLSLSCCTGLERLVRAGEGRCGLRVPFEGRANRMHCGLNRRVEDTWQEDSWVSGLKTRRRELPQLDTGKKSGAGLGQCGLRRQPRGLMEPLGKQGAVSFFFMEQSLISFLV